MVVLQLTHYNRTLVSYSLDDCRSEWTLNSMESYSQQSHESDERTLQQYTT